jgi:hypothetical protein
MTQNNKNERVVLEMKIMYQELMLQAWDPETTQRMQMAVEELEQDLRKIDE